MELSATIITGMYRKYKAHGLKATYLSSNAGATETSVHLLRRLETLFA